MKRRDFIKTVGLGCLGCCCRPLSLSAQEPPPHPGTRSQGPTWLPSSNGKTYDSAVLMNRYDGLLESKRALYVTVFGESEIDGIMQEMRDSFESIIPDIPYIGRRNYHLQYLVPNAEDIAEYLVADKYGMTAASFGKLRWEHTYEEIMTMPEDLRSNIGRSTFGLLSLLKMRWVAYRSQNSPHEDDSVCYFLPADGDAYDWGMDYTQCCTNILAQQYDAADLMTNLICNYDYIPGEAFNIGYFRTQTVAEGADTCDLRWKWGKEVTIPE